MPVISKASKAPAARKSAKAAAKAKKAAKQQPKTASKAPAKKVAKSVANTAAKKSPAGKAAKRDESPVERLRRICLSLPESTEVEAWGEPTFRVKGKIFATYASPGGHHGDRPAAWILSVSMEQDMMLRLRPDRYFKPPYVGPSGWIGAYLDKSPPWKEIEELLREGWRRRAPKKIAALLGD